MQQLIFHLFLAICETLAGETLKQEIRRLMRKHIYIFLFIQF